MATKYRLELFIVGQSAKAQKAEAILRRLCATRLAGQVDLQVTDVLENPEAAEEANIIATPTLVRRAPLPVRLLIGDLSSSRAVERGLGLEPANQSEDDDDGSETDNDY